MPVFFLHVLRDGERFVDSEGYDFPDANAAMIEALLARRDFVREAEKQGDGYDGAIEVENEAGNIVAVVPFDGDLPAIGIRPPPR